ncbi:hypothetical protein CKAH01_18638 [Colletotrichum kahawae]|uniref:Thiaminase-2/PQQC domain-containing protein n=1 Tax=Colletotrichum kahawae TaxID=34407 RepID=A0AAE0D1X6_COLKA|nr:hypothetical protein CKAH01_18638 [Colletotrichum kahawae]
MSLSCLAGPSHLSSPNAPARISLAIANINLDADQAGRGVSPREILDDFDKINGGETFINTLWNEPSNEDVVSAFLGNAFVWFAAQNADEVVLPYYQAYGLQDYFYLVDYLRFEALRLNAIPEDDWDSVAKEAASLSSNIQEVDDWRDTLIEELKVTPEVLGNAERSVAELAYANVLQKHASIDNWFDLHVIMIPCVYGWPKLAKMVDDHPKTRKDTVFYKTWIKPNLDISSADHLSGASFKAIVSAALEHIKD